MVAVAGLCLAGCADEEAGAGECEDAVCGSTGGDPGGSGESGGPSTTGQETEGSGGAETSGGAAQGIPCDVAEVLSQNCWSCHGDVPSFGAPMPLTSLDDFLVPAITDPAQPVSELVLARIFDEQKPMPATGMPGDARDVLAGWIGQGLPEGTGGCDTDPGGDDPDSGPDALPCEPTHVFVAHGDDGDDSKFDVPVVDDLYECFTFASPVSEPTQATAWAPIIDDERVVHHWILYKSKEALPDGAHGPCDMPADALFVAGWAPGGGNFVMPQDVGLEFASPDDSFILQVHYNNTAGHTDAADRSGVALCTAEEPRPTLAGIVTLGSVSIAIPPQTEGHQVEGTCPSWITSYLQEPLHVISSFPHMHELGTSIRTEILRGGSENDIEALIDVPVFDFANQQFYPHEPEVLIQPGDAVRTTCMYDNPSDQWVYMGEGTGDEMCFNFAMVYPIDGVGENRQCGLF